MGVGNLLGQPFYKYLNKQVEIRQEVYGSGFTGNNTNSNRRSAAYQQYLNSKTSWVKLASSVIVQDKKEIENTDLNTGEVTTQTYEGGLRFLDKLQLPESYKGVNLAREAVLFSGLQGTGNIIPVQDQKVIINGEETTVKNANAFTGNTNLIPRSGISKTTNVWNLDAAYGLGGLDFGQQPMPGITDVQIKSLNRGSLKRAEVTIKANNKYQFELIETLYLRLGYSMLLEWGNSHYLPNEGGEIIVDTTTGVETKIPTIDTIKNTYIEEKWFSQQGKSTYNLLQDLENLRVKYSGNYDGFFGKVVNFNWKFNSDGTYDITLSIISMGDIVESLKFNSLYHPSDGIPVNEEDDISDPINHMNKVRLNPQLFNASDNSSPYLSLVEYSDIPEELPDRVEGEEEEDALKFQRRVSAQQNKYGYYWRFGDFLGWVQKHIIPTYTSGNDEFKQIRIDANEQLNVMSAYPNQFSVDPRVCIVRTNYGQKLTFSENPPFYKHMAEWVQTKTPIGEVPEAPHGKIMNIYINFNQITSIINANKNKKGDVDFYTFFSKLLDSINKALGGINNLEFVVNEDSNTIKIIDQNIIAGSAVDKKSGVNFYNKFIKDLRIADKSTKLEVFGYGQRSGSYTSNFVKDFSFESKIDKNLANTLSISAAAGGGFVGEDTTAFASWSRGLVDKYKEFINPPEQDNIPPVISNENPYYKVNAYDEVSSGLDRTKSSYFDENGNVVDNSEEYNEDLATQERLQKQYNTNDYIDGGDGNTGIDLVLKYTGTDYYITQAGHDKLKQLINNVFNLDIGYFITECFGTNITGKQVPQIVANNEQDKAQVLEQISQGNQPNRTLTIIKDGGRYDEFNPAMIARGESSMKNYFLQMGEYHYIETGKPTGTGGFIPLDLGLTVDGISGVKIYNSINVDTSFLPSTYGDDLDFIVRGVNHKLSDGQWDTEIDSLSIPRPTEKIYEKEDTELYDDINTSGSILTGSYVTPEPIFTPLPLSVNNYIIRMDGNGKGVYNAPRTSKKGYHAGLDFLVVNSNGDTRGNTDGQAVRAPFSGRLLNSISSTDKPNLGGAKIIGTGAWEGYMTKIFYFSKDQEVIGQKPPPQTSRDVEAGEIIGYAQNMIGTGKYSAEKENGEPANQFLQNHIHIEVYYNDDKKEVPLQSSVNDIGGVEWMHQGSRQNPVPALFEIQGTGVKQSTGAIDELKVKEKINSEWRRISNDLNNSVHPTKTLNQLTSNDAVKLKGIINVIDNIINDSFTGEPTQTLKETIEKIPQNEQNQITDIRESLVKYDSNMQEFKNTFIELYIVAENIPTVNANYDAKGENVLRLAFSENQRFALGQVVATSRLIFTPDSDTNKIKAINDVPYDLFFMLLVLTLWKSNNYFDSDFENNLENYYPNINSKTSPYIREVDV